MIVLDRQDVVTKLSELVDNSVGPSAGNLAEAVLDYVPAAPGGVSPLVACAPAGSRPYKSTAGRLGDKHSVTVFVFVLYAHTGRTIVERDAWTALNALRTKIVKVLLDNSYVEGFWNLVDFPDDSRISAVKIDDQGYLIEAIPVDLIIA